MTANKARVQVRGTVGKSVRFPTDTGSTGATIGLNFRLPDGSIPTLQQLAAALVTGSAIQDQPGNIVPPGGGPTIIWQNIQYVPAPIKNPPRYVYQEEDGGEDYSRMAVPGPVGPRGFQGFPAVRADDPEDPMPGPPGQAGVAGAAGPPGVISAVHLWPDDPEDHISIPGAAGAAGATGSAGPPGAISAVHLWPDDAEDPGLIPGAPGQAGATGSAGPPGVISAIHLWPDDPEDPGLIPGAAGPVGLTGATGAPGVISAVHLWPDDPEDQIHMPGERGNVGATGPAGVISAVHLYPDDAEDAGLIPGPAGPQGATGAAGPTGSSASAAGWAAYLDQDPADDILSALRAVPDNLNLQSLAINAPPGKQAILAHGNGGASTIQCDVSAANFAIRAIGFAGTTSFTGNTALALSVGGSTSTNDYTGIDFTDTSTPKARIAAVFTGSGSNLSFGTSSNYTTGITVNALTIDFNGALAVPLTPLTSAATRAMTGLANFLAAATTRTSTTVLAAEAGMTVTCNETGWYRVKMLVLFSEVTLGTGGFKMDFNAGTATIATPTLTVVISSAGTAFTSFASQTNLTTTPLTATVTTTAASPDYMWVTGTIRVTVAGTFGLRWAQNSSSANATSMAIGSHIVLTKIG